VAAEAEQPAIPQAQLLLVLALTDRDSTVVPALHRLAEVVAVEPRPWEPIIPREPPLAVQEHYMESVV